jgi:hypothetical protein
VGKLQLINYEYTIQIMRNIVPLSRKYITSQIESETLGDHIRMESWIS